MKLSYRGIAYEPIPPRRILETETTAKYRGVEYTIQQFGQVLPAPEPKKLRYRGANYRQCLNATQVKSRYFLTTNLTDSDFFIN